MSYGLNPRNIAALKKHGYLIQTKAYGPYTLPEQKETTQIKKIDTSKIKTLKKREAPANVL
jgi:hypothetical protein